MVDGSSVASNSGSELYLPVSILISALLVSGTIFVVGGDVSKNLTGLTTVINGAGSGPGNNVPSGNSGDSGTVAPDSGNQPAPQVDLSKLPDDDPVEGSADAKVTIVEFSDFQCPFCGRFYNDTLQQVRKDYIDTGKAKLVYRDFPLSFHPEAQKAAEAGECADEQGRFRGMHDKIFENQQSMSLASYKQWAKDIGLKSAQFDQCLDSGKYASEIQKDFADGSAAGVSGTPSFFINGQRIVGAQPYSVFKQVIEAELAK